MGQPQLQTLLDSFFSSEEIADGSRAYFQPPENVKMVYPAIVYHLDFEKSSHADNLPYARKPRYQVTVISRDPQHPAADLVADLPSASFERQFPADELNHKVYNVFFD